MSNLESDRADFIGLGIAHKATERHGYHCWWASQISTPGAATSAATSDANTLRRWRGE
jgi:hypothetical protein